MILKQQQLEGYCERCNNPLGYFEDSKHTYFCFKCEGYERLNRIQIKSKSNLKEFEEYQTRFDDMQEYSRFYYVAHSPSEDLQEFEDDGVFKVMNPKEISEWTIKYGLIDWILDKF